MSNKQLAPLIKQEVQKPAADDSSAIARTQNTAIADLKIASQGLFDESKALWEEFVAFDQEHQLSQKVAAQLWRLTKAVGKPALVLSLKGAQAAVITLSSADNRTALAARFNRFRSAQEADASLELTED